MGLKGSQERVFERLDDMVEQSRLDDVSVRVTGERLCLCETCTGTDAGGALLEAFRDLDDWGSGFDASVSQFFERPTIDSPIAGHTARALVPPRVTVALYVDESLSGAFPCRMGTETYSVEDFFEALQQFAATERVAVEQ